MRPPGGLNCYLPPHAYACNTLDHFIFHQYRLKCPLSRASNCFKGSNKLSNWFGFRFAPWHSRQLGQLQPPTTFLDKPGNSPGSSLVKITTWWGQTHNRAISDNSKQLAQTQCSRCGHKLANSRLLLFCRLNDLRGEARWGSQERHGFLPFLAIFGFFLRSWWWPLSGTQADPCPY